MTESQITYDTIAQLSAGTHRQKLAPADYLPSGATVVDAHSLPLLVREPIWVRAADKVYDAQQEGLYRFYNWGKIEYDHPDGLPRAVHSSGTYLASDHSYDGFIRYDNDVLKLLGGLAVLHLHGHRHDMLSHEERIHRLRHGSLSLVCGDISIVAQRILEDLGFRTRILYLTRLTGRWNTYDNGHILLEFYWPTLDKWVMVDVDMHCMFKRDETYLNFSEMHPMVIRGESYEIDPLTPPGELIIDSSDSMNSDFPGMRIFEPIAQDETCRRHWYNQMFASGALSDGDIRVHASQHVDAARLRRHMDVQVVDWDTFVERFYSLQPSL